MTRQLMTRRHWLRSAGAASITAVGARAGLTPARATKRAHHQSSPIFDAHIHVWSDDTDRFPLAPGFIKEDLWAPSYSIEEYWQECYSAGVTHVNLIQMTWYGLDHSYIIDIIRNDPKHFVGTGVIPAISDVSLASPDSAMVALAKQGILAFRVRTKNTRGAIRESRRWLDFPGYEKMFKTAAKHRLALSFLMSADDLPEIGRMCARFPESPVILDHTAGISRKPVRQEAVQAFCAMAKHKNVMVKIGAFYAFGDRTPPYTAQLPVIHQVIDAFGPERCMWETDSPLRRPGASLPDPPHSCQAAADLIRDHADFLSASDKQQILFKTAYNFFFNR